MKLGNGVIASAEQNQQTEAAKMKRHKQASQHLNVQRSGSFKKNPEEKTSKSSFQKRKSPRWQLLLHLKPTFFALADARGLGTVQV